MNSNMTESICGGCGGDCGPLGCDHLESLPPTAPAETDGPFLTVVRDLRADLAAEKSACEDLNKREVENRMELAVFKTRLGAANREREALMRERNDAVNERDSAVAEQVATARQAGCAIAAMREERDAAMAVVAAVCERLDEIRADNGDPDRERPTQDIFKPHHQLQVALAGVK